ncbi:MAG: YlxM family DNA-binding protein [Thermicanus sp.]|nr:YlxM family DNA-binding protein [Thermicanus sp.]
MLEKTTRMNLLYDLYGELLTEKQQQYMEWYYRADLSLGEIAEEVHLSRQAVYDQLHRAEAQLEHLEDKLKLLQKGNEREEALRKLEVWVRKVLPPGDPRYEELSSILDRLREKV